MSSKKNLSKIDSKKENLSKIFFKKENYDVRPKKKKSLIAHAKHMQWVSFLIIIYITYLKKINQWK